MTEEEMLRKALEYILPNSTEETKQKFLDDTNFMDLLKKSMPTIDRIIKREQET